MSRVYITGNLENIKRYSGGRWNKLARNVRSNQSLDDNVVTHRVMDVADYPSAIKCGISCIVLEKRSVHLRNALSLMALCARTHYELMSVYMGHACICVTKVDQASTDAPYKVDTIKANDNRVIVVHNETIQLISWSN